MQDRYQRDTSNNNNNNNNNNNEDYETRTTQIRPVRTVSYKIDKSVIQSSSRGETNYETIDHSLKRDQINSRPARAVSSPWLSADRKHKLKNGIAAFLGTEFVQLVINHFGYAGIVAGGYFFKLAIAASVASYFAFLSAAVVGGLVTYFPSRAVDWVLDKYTNVSNAFRELATMALHIGLSPVAGAWVLNLALGWNLALVPMVAVSGAGLAIAAMLMLGMVGYTKYSKHAATKRHPETIAKNERHPTPSALRNNSTFSPKYNDPLHLDRKSNAPKKTGLSF